MSGRATPGWGAALAVLAALALPAAAGAEHVLPEGNSAVDQYTESYPTAGGDRNTADRRPRTPAQVIGPREAERLESRGEAGEATAELAAATAPPQLADRARGQGGSGEARRPRPGARGGGPPAGVPDPGGSSGLGAILGQATGLSTSEGPGPLLPLAILATALWALAYLWRRRSAA